MHCVCTEGNEQDVAKSGFNPSPATKFLLVLAQVPTANPSILFYFFPLLLFRWHPAHGLRDTVEAFSLVGAKFLGFGAGVWTAQAAGAISAPLCGTAGLFP